MYQKDLTLNNHQRLICYKTQPLTHTHTHTHIYIYIYIYIYYNSVGLSLSHLLGRWQTKCDIIWRVLNISDRALILYHIRLYYIIFIFFIMQ